MKTQRQKAEDFAKLHQKGSCFVIPNPWDLGSAKLLEEFGFAALASTGAGFAFSQGRADLTINVREMFPFLMELSQATGLPVSADLQNGFGADPEAVAATILEAAKTGIVGGSIEDASGDPESPVYNLDLATERIRNAVLAARTLDFKFTLTARAENYWYGRLDLKDTIRRLQAYQEAGADVLYAPGIQTKEEIKAIVSSVDRPLNVLAGAHTVAELQELGVGRISLGGSLARAAYGALIKAAIEVQTTGTFEYAAGAVSGKEINRISQPAQESPSA